VPAFVACDSASLRPGRHIHVRAFDRFDEILYLVEKSSLLVVYGDPFGGFQFLLGAATAFVERLQPQGSGDVGDGFG
jgi:hypothetical protein